MLPAPKVRADYDILSEIAKNFQQQADHSRQILQDLVRSKDVLEGGRWRGRGAQKFYDELNGVVLPAIQRLVGSLEHASQVTMSIRTTMKQAEDNAAAVLRDNTGADLQAPRNPIATRDVTANDRRFPGVLKAGEDQFGNTYLMVETENGPRWATPVMQGSGRAVLVAYDPDSGQRGLPLVYNPSTGHYHSTGDLGGLPGGAGLKALVGKKVVTPSEIQATGEYKALLSQATADEALMACQLLLRGTSTNLTDALTQVRQQRAVFGGVEKLLGKAMRWKPSGPGGDGPTDFAKFIHSPEKFNITPDSTINCWEMILLGSFGNHVTSISKLQEIYSAKPAQFETKMTGIFTSWSQAVYDPSTSSGRPVAGDILLFDGLGHVAIATGKVKYGVDLGDNYQTMGGTEIISFWPAPGQSSFGPGATTTVQNTTIEAIQRWWTNNGGRAPMKVTFGSPRWNTLQ